MFIGRNTKEWVPKLGVALFLLAGLFVMASPGCRSNRMSATTASEDKPRLLGIFPPAPDRSGAQLWAANCNRCHNAPPAERFSDAQWAVIVHHMRLRANLTGEEARKITEFLQAGN